MIEEKRGRERGQRKDFGPGTSKRGLKAGFLTIRKWKARNRHRHLGGTGPPDKSVVYWVKMIDGKVYGTYQQGPKVMVLPTPLGKRP